MTIAFDLLLATYRRLGNIKEGTQYVAATGSGTTAIVCAALTEADDYWNGGAALIITDAGGAGAAPQSESRDISDFVASTDTVTVGTAFSTAVAIGDSFGITTPEYSRSQVLRALNDALLWYGPFPQEDTSLDTAASTLLYTLPAATIFDLRKVFIAPSTTSPQYWTELVGWGIDYTTGKLRFEYQPPTGYDIKLVYYANHAALTADSTAVNSLAYTPAITEYAYAKLIEYAMQAVGKDTSHRANLMNDARAQAEQFKWAHPVPQIQRLPKFANLDKRPGGIEGFRYILP